MLAEPLRPLTAEQAVYESLLPGIILDRAFEEPESPIISSLGRLRDGSDVITGESRNNLRSMRL